MSWAQFIPMAAQLGGSIFDSNTAGGNAETSKRVGYATANANEERIRRNSAQELGNQRAATAQSGFDPSSGSMLKLQGDSAGNAELDALTERYKGQFNAWQQDEQVQRARDKNQFILDPLFGGRRNKLSYMVLGPGAGLSSYFAGNNKITPFGVGGPKKG